MRVCYQRWPTPSSFPWVEWLTHEFMFGKSAHGSCNSFKVPIQLSYGDFNLMILTLLLVTNLTVSNALDVGMTIG